MSPETDRFPGPEEAGTDLLEGLMFVSAGAPDRELEDRLLDWYRRRLVSGG